MFDRRLITNFDWPFFVVLILLAVLGLGNLYSAATSFDTVKVNYFSAQLIWTAIGVATLLVTTSIHFRHFRSLSYWLYWGSVLLLLLALILGRQIAGNQNWLELGPVRLQPSELGKLGLIFALARYMLRWPANQAVGLKELFPALLIYLIPTVLVLKQGDLGSSLFYGFIFITLILVHGVRFKVVATFAFMGIFICIIAYFFALSPYQKNRIQFFLKPELDRRGAGYHLVQSKIGVGSGGLTGKGFLKGETNKLKFIPERHTDFVFAVLAEEWGFVGSCFVLLTFLLFFFLGLNIALKATDRYSFYLAVGLCSLFFWHFVINLGGILSIMPMTGVPLPFFSYGGSALLTDWLAAGLLLNISMRRFMFT